MIKHEELSDPNSCLNRAHPDERVFVLLARDIAAPDVIRYWAWRRVDLGKNKADDPQIQRAFQDAILMEKQRAVMPANPCENGK